MTLILDLKPEEEAVLAQQASANGYEKIADYVKKILFDREKTIDEIFAPFRKHTEEISESEINDLVKRARKDYFTGKNSK
jgi:hypothetical protein